jgi:hypothetical protein
MPAAKLIEYLEDLDYVGDIVLLSHDFKDMPAKLYDWVKEPQWIRLLVNTAKSKNLCGNMRSTEAFKIGEEAIERVENFLYLGSKIDENRGTLLDIQ